MSEQEQDQPVYCPHCLKERGRKNRIADRKPNGEVEVRCGRCHRDTVIGGPDEKKDN